MRPAASAPISSGGLGFWRRFGAGVLLLPACLSGMAMAAEDLPGARDPEGIPRFPRAWVVAFSEQSGFAPQEFVISAVEKIRRELRIEQKLRIEAKALGVTYRIPSGTPRAEVIEHYRRLLGPDALFSCEERDCGRSNGWANNVFGEALLYGPDGNQFYIAAELDGRLAAIYVIERGNRRIYAHVQVLRPRSEVHGKLNLKLTEALAGDGFAVIGGLRPRRDGTLPGEGLQILRELAPRLRIFQRQTLYVVCHLYGPEQPEWLIDRAERCAAAVSEELQAGLNGGEGPKLAPFGAGPLLPRTASAPRVELVLPHRQQRD